MTTDDAPALYIGIDPGLATGLAVFSPVSGIQLCTLEKPRVYTFLDTVVSYDTAIGIEDFIPNATTHKKTYQPEANRIIGAVDYLSDRTGARLHIQRNTDKAGVTDGLISDIAPRLDFLSTHEKDAFRHLVVLLNRNYKPAMGELTDWIGG